MRHHGLASAALLAALVLAAAAAAAAERRAADGECPWHGDAPVRIAGVSGSLRAASANTGMLRRARAYCAAHATECSVEIVDISALPVYNKDQDSKEALPAAAAAFREAIRGADAVLFATTEYNFSPSAALKNAIEWGFNGGVWDMKPGAVMGAGAAKGTARAQHIVRQIAVDLNMPLMLRPEVQVGNWWDGPVFDIATGDLADNAGGKKWGERIDVLVHNFVAWTHKVGECA